MNVNVTGAGLPTNSTKSVEYSRVCPIVVTLNRNYVSYALISLFSIACACKTQGVLYRIFVLNRDLEEHDKIAIINAVGLNPHLKVEFVDVKDFNCADYYKCSPTGGYHENEVSYYKLVMLKAFCQLPNYLYLDLDTVVMFDPAMFLGIDCKGKCIVGVSIDNYNAYFNNPNILEEVKKQCDDFNERFKRQGLPQRTTFDPETIPTPEYYRDMIGYTEPNQYISTALMYVNNAELHKYESELDFHIEKAKNPKPRLRDKDWINMFLARHGGALLLRQDFNLEITDAAWLGLLEVNQPMASMHFNPRNFLQLYGKTGAEIASKFRNFVGMIHYVGTYKPWSVQNRAYNMIWWACMSSSFCKYEYYRSLNQRIDKRSLEALEEMGQILFPVPEDYIRFRESLRTGYEKHFEKVEAEAKEKATQDKANKGKPKTINPPKMS